MQHLAQRILSALQINSSPANDHQDTVDLFTKVLGIKPFKDGTREAHWKFDGMQISYYSYQLREAASYGMTISRLAPTQIIRGKGYFKIVTSSFTDLMAKAMRSRSEYVTPALVNAFARVLKLYLIRHPANPEA